MRGKMMFWLCLIAMSLLISAPAFGQITVSITQIDPSGFPDEIDTFVRILDAAGETIPGLTKADFMVTEDGLPVPSYDVIPATETGEGINWALVIDTSGSMVGDRLAATKIAAHTFIDNMEPGDRAAVIRFSNQAVVVQGLTQYKSLLHNAINSLQANGVTALYDGFYLGLDELSQATRPRAVIALSDGTDSGVSEHTLNDILNLAHQDSLGIPCYTIGLVVPDATVLQTIANSTQAEYIDVSDPDELPNIYIRISQSIRSQYQVTFSTPRPVYDGTTRTVRITYNHSPYPFGEIRYTVDQAPIIIRTPETIALSDFPQNPGTEFDIRAEITDNTEVVGAQMYFRTTPPYGVTDVPYNPTQMQYEGEDIYHATIPGQISDPFGSTAYGVDYYLEASDGLLTAQDPRYNPQVFPWQIPVYPNEFPLLEHEPVTQAGIGYSVPITCSAFDTTDIVADVSIYYRRSDNIFYTEIPMTLIGNNQWIGTIPGEEMTAYGIDYWLVATDNFNLRTFSPADRSFWHIEPGGEPGPFDLTAGSGYDGYVPLFWEGATEHPVINYRVYRATSETGNFIPIAQNLTSTSYNDETVINGVNYWYYVTAMYPNPWGESLPSNIAVATPGGLAGDIIVIVPDTRGIPGDTLVVPVNVNNSLHVAGGDITIQYCPDMLEAIAVNRGYLTQNIYFNHQIFANSDSIQFSFSSSQELSGEGGSLAEITFRVNPESPLGTTCHVIPRYAGIYNLNAVPLRVATDPGLISLGSKGDVNGDGRINAQDAILTLRLSVDDPDYFPTAYERWAAEVDGTDFFTDGLPDAFDATLILRVAVGYIVVIPKEPNMRVSDQQQFLVLGGLPPYEWYSTQPGVGFIDGLGMFTGIGPGLTQVVVIDAAERSDQTREFGVTFEDRGSSEGFAEIQTDALEVVPEVEIDGHQMIYRLRLSTTSGVTNGFIRVNYDADQLTLTDLEPGGLLEATLFRSNVSEIGTVLAGFAKAIPLDGLHDILLQLYFSLDDPAAFDWAQVSTELLLADELGEIYPVLMADPTPVEGNAEVNLITTLLAQNYPNPFASKTVINFALPTPGKVNLTVYNLAGQRVKTLASETHPAGYHHISWNGRDNEDRDVANGIYFYRLQTETEELTRRLILMR